MCGAWTRQFTAADARVALSGQQDRQPDRDSVKYRRQIVGETEVGITPAVRDPVILRTGRVQPDVDGYRPKTGQRVGQSDGDQDGVGGSPHDGSNQHDANKHIADDNYDYEQWNKVAVDERIAWYGVHKERSTSVAWSPRHRHCRRRRLHHVNYSSSLRFSRLCVLWVRRLTCNSDSVSHRLVRLYC